MSKMNDKLIRNFRFGVRYKFEKPCQSDLIYSLKYYIK
ncbi:unnamed protein product [Psylliodes chrysocephalus]|uniref:Uncharacterized protein n=1 Tax=Psylliodes chrysocephalus TaxID=3402493 RepID=A0A9P0CI66_9CUCU|nr:unnamed protein product [Psylliodes chrysocephala]